MFSSGVIRMCSLLAYGPVQRIETEMWRERERERERERREGEKRERERKSGKCILGSLPMERIEEEIVNAREGARERRRKRMINIYNADQVRTVWYVCGNRMCSVYANTSESAL